MKYGTHRLWWFRHTADGHHHGDHIHIIPKATSRKEVRQIVPDDFIPKETH
jgi:hypothetical protein